MPDSAKPRAIAAWLYVVAAMVVAIVVVGGITRLTESGLSITEWKPVSGIIPPLTDAQWQAEFAAFRKIPQAQTIHAGITLDGFKAIFFWEYIHRLLARLIGTVFALPLLWFALRRAIPKGYFWRLVALLALGGLQGALGWIMVRSGLTDRTEVAPALLATHLITALVTLAGIVWTALDLRMIARDPVVRPARLTGLGLAAGVILLVQLTYGALMAGLRAGLVSDTWPLMNGAFFPGPNQTGESLGTMLTSDPAIVHFIHRWWAWAVVAALIVLARAVRPVDRRASVAIHIALGVQILLGIATVMSGVNITLAALHQLVGALLVVAVTWGAHALGAASGVRALLALAMICLPGVAFAKFAPADGTPLKLSVAEERAGSRFTSERRIVFHKTATGYTADLTIAAAGATDGQPDIRAMARRVLTALAGKTIHYTLDDTGTVIAVADQDALMAIVAKAFEAMGSTGKDASPDRQAVATRTAAMLRALPPEAQRELLASLLTPAIGGKLADLPVGEGAISLPAGAPTGQRAELPGRQRVTRGADGRLVIDTNASGPGPANDAPAQLRIVQHREIDVTTGLVLVNERRTDTWLTDKPDTITTTRTTATLTPVL